MIKDFKTHRNILINLINLLSKDYGECSPLTVSRALLLKKDDISENILQRILYGLISYFLIDEITPQPTEKTNFIDMGSYYYRSESYNMDFPLELHDKYKIPVPHIKRKRSLFASSQEFIENYLQKQPAEIFDSVYIIQSKDPDFKMPYSRQLFLIKYFLQCPKLFNKMLMARYSCKFKNSLCFNARKKNGYDAFLANKIKRGLHDNRVRDKLETLLRNKQDYILTSSGTAANQLVIQYLTGSNKHNFFHKYWYFENMGENKSYYFKNIQGQELSFDNFFINLYPTNFVDISNPTFFEDITVSIKYLLDKLASSNKNHNIIIDVTTNPFFDIPKKYKNISIFKTISLSKYQEGLNTTFAGIVIANKTAISEMIPVSRHFGFSLNKLDEYFLWLPDINLFKNRILKVCNFAQMNLIEYKDWKSIPIGLSVVLVPNKKIIDFQLKKLSNQIKFTDRKFVWLLRNKINQLILNSGIKDVYFGDSFLFPTTRINMQGSSIKTRQHTRGDIFKYRLPRISPGYECKVNDVKKYEKIYKGIIDIYSEVYELL